MIGKEKANARKKGRNTSGPTRNDAGKTCAVYTGICTGDKAAHGMAKKVIRERRVIVLAHMLMKGVCVFNECVRTVQGIENTAAIRSTLATVANVIVSCHDVSCATKGAGKIVVAKDMLGHAMVYLDNSARAHGRRGLPNACNHC